MFQVHYLRRRSTIQESRITRLPASQSCRAIWTCEDVHLRTRKSVDFTTTHTHDRLATIYDYAKQRTDYMPAFQAQEVDMGQDISVDIWGVWSYVYSVQRLQSAEMLQRRAWTLCLVLGSSHIQCWVHCFHGTSLSSGHIEIRRLALLGFRRRLDCACDARVRPPLSCSGRRALVMSAGNFSRAWHCTELLASYRLLLAWHVL